MTMNRNTQQAAAAAGISLMTLQRWIAARKVKAPELIIRNGRAVRLWNRDDLARLREVKKAIYRKGRGRKKVKS
jgi:predicted site-specific integrase-resolvase